MLWDTAPNLAYISRCPDNVTSPPASVSSHHYISWILPYVGTINVNTNGSFINGFTHGGIGGFFQDNQRNPLLHFEKHGGIDSVIHTEILAIRDGLLIVVASR